MAEGLSTKEIQIRVAGWAVASPKQEFLVIDGIFGPKTEAAVKRFQRANGLAVNGKVQARTTAALNALQKPDRSTAHFNWGEFMSRDGSRFSGGKIEARRAKENVRRLMWKLEALRQKLGNNPIHITSGFRSIAHNNTIPNSSDNSQHLYGTAADFVVRDRRNTTVTKTAKACGFSGVKAYLVTGHTHVDSRAENEDNLRDYWWP